MRAVSVDLRLNSRGLPLSLRGGINPYLIALSGFLACFLLSFVAGSFLVQPSGSRAVTGLGLVGEPSITLNADRSVIDVTPSSGISPDSTGTYVSAAQELSVTTNVPTGYTLSISSTYNSTLGRAGTLGSPLALTNNTWGYAMKANPTANASNMITNGFSTGASDYTTPTPSTTSKWANPAQAASTNIKKTTTAALAASPDKTTIYYGAKLTNALAAGTYSNLVKFTAVGNVGDVVTPVILAVYPNGNITSLGGDEIQINGTGFAANGTSVTTAVKIGTQDCLSVRIETNAGTDTIYCTAPAAINQSADSTVGVSVTTWAGTDEQSSEVYYKIPTMIIDTPLANQELPSGTTSTLLYVRTNLAATCTWAIDPSFTYSLTPDNADKIGHGATMSNLLDGRSYTILVTCTFTGVNGTTDQISMTRNFSVANPIPTIQSISSSTCPTANPLATKDERDGHIYMVQKLADGRCWMLTNLAYGGPGAGTEFTTGAGQNTNTDQVASASNWNRQNPPYNNQQQWVDPTNPNVTQEASVARCAVAYHTNALSIDYTECGYLYNWCAALGDSGFSTCHMDSTGGDGAGNMINAGVGLCPAGWRLPTGGTGGEFQQLITVIGTEGGFSSVWKVALAGQFFAGQSGLYAQSRAGSYWSATAVAAQYGAHLDVSSSNYANERNSNKYFGMAVRCIAN